MATSLPIFTRVDLTITLTDGTSSVIAFAAIPAKPFLVRDILYRNTTNPAGSSLLSISFFGAADESQWIGTLRETDMSSTGGQGTLGYSARPIANGLWYEATGSAGSAADTIDVTVVLQSYSDR